MVLKWQLRRIWAAITTDLGCNYDGFGLQLRRIWAAITTDLGCNYDGLKFCRNFVSRYCSHQKQYEIGSRIQNPTIQNDVGIKLTYRGQAQFYSLTRKDYGLAL
jgi:hypothetical protein